ncbi:YcjF family protein [Salipiger mangrovisoli]|uniref:50S ribosome-binding GTPase n=1 Tax=Salipiger mangrovisoli TaxID=2865933 RepID=A0ABR9X7Z5_9RHOB|nr:GTPase [Salipiger mangrovisoli]MBE9639730.1 50S ribosome-binding GTPase [Salipiger mangrovisoli]
MLNRILKRAKRTPAEGAGEVILPVVWLLGKTGAGKSSLVGALTEQSDAEVGDGFQPCTRSAQSYDFPEEQPLVRFLDTRGLGEAGYDPSEDLAACRDRSHVLLVVCRLDDPVQGMVADAVADIARADGRMRAILVLTGKDLVPDPDALERAERGIAARIGRAAGREIPRVTLSLAPSETVDTEGLDGLRAQLLESLPAAGLLLEKSRAGDAEHREFQKHKRCVLSYAGVALTSDLAPVVGLVAVPATQLKMLHELGLRYGITWDRKVGAAFLSTMGLSLGARYATNFGLRELAKLIPVYGQTVGAATAGAISFATTYALGRAAAYFLYRRAQGSSPSEEELRAVYQRAFRRSSDEAD